MENVYKFYQNSLKDLKPYDPHEIPHKVKLNANENPYGLPKNIIDEILKEARKLKYSLYPNANATELSQEVSSTFGLNLDNIIIGNGSDELIEYLIKAFTQKGRGVISPMPSFAMYKIYSTMHHADFIQVPLVQKDFSLDVEKLLKEARKESASLIFLSYPNSPTANYFQEEKIIRILKESGCLVVVDEAYYEFGGKTFAPLISQFDNLVILRTFSKAFSLASLRVGYLLSNAKVVREIRKVKSPFNVNAFSQLAARIVFKYKDILQKKNEKIICEREKLVKKINEFSSFKAHPSQTNFIFTEVKSLKEQTIVFDGLLEKGILIQIVNEPDFSSTRYFFRITVGSEEENLLLIDGLSYCQKILKR